MGGPSSEHEVSLNTGKGVIRNLDRHKYVAEPVVITRDGSWLMQPVKKRISEKDAGIPKKNGRALMLASPLALEKVKAEKPDAIFIAMHGEFGEDGTIQGLLESFGIPYTGSGILASSLGMDKPRQAALFRQAGLKVPEFIVLQKSEWRKNKKSILRKIINDFSISLVIKPANRGSSVGVSIVKVRPGLTKRKPGLTNLSDALNSAFSYSDTVMVQKFIRGREITCGAVEGANGALLPLPPVEIFAKAGKFYDYKSKYADGGSEHVILPKNMSRRLVKKMQDAACMAHNILGCRGMSRTDFILSPDGILHVLEINTLPGMTSTSLLPESAKAIGIDFSKLLNLIIESALRKR